MNNIKVVAFDCDGVMFDTVKANTAYYNSVLHHFNRPDMTPEQFAYSHMHTADNAMVKLFDDEKTLEGYFDIVVTALDVKRPKPYPDQLLKILEHFQIEPQQAIYVGDSELDAIAAKSAGIPIIAYNNKSLSADFHINSLKEIEDILEI
jgi:phosphoglycolate phosphatase-like HAD superfamily hydrolase